MVSIVVKQKTTKHASLLRTKTLTEANAGEQAKAVLRREAGGEQGLEDIVGKGQGDDGLIGRVNHQHGDPQTQEPGTKKKNQGGWHGVRDACEA